MNTLQKPQLKKPWVYIKQALFLISLFLVILFLFLSACSAKLLSEASEHPLTVTAQIVSVDVISSDTVSYDAIMRYTYEGVTYEAVYDSFSTRSKAEALLGTSVTAQVDLNEPARTLRTYKQNACGRLLCSGICMIFLCWCLCFPHRKSYVKTYGWELETVKKDIFLHTPYPIALVLIWVICCGIVVLGFPQVYLNGSMFLYNLILPAVYTAVGAWWLIRYLLDRNRIRKNQIRLSKDICTRKSVEKDSDGQKHYYLKFSNGKRNWRRSIRLSDYDAIVEDTYVDTAYLGNRKKPALHYFDLIDEVF